MHEIVSSIVDHIICLQKEIQENYNGIKKTQIRRPDLHVEISWMWSTGVQLKPNTNIITMQICANPMQCLKVIVTFVIVMQTGIIVPTK